MFRNILTAATVLAVSLSAFAAKPKPTEVKGTVTSTDGRPIAGVTVSDGFNVSVTDALGQYCFPRIDEAYYVYVSIPSAFEVPIRQGHPAFYKKLSDEKTYDFVLNPLKNGPEKDFNLFLMADPQCQYIWHVRRLHEEAMPDLKAYSKKVKGPSYGMTLGDIGYSEGHRNTVYLMPIIRDEMAMERSGMPIFQTVGNHDFEYDLVDLEPASPTVSLRRDRMYESVFGPANYSFNRGDAHIVSMNDVVFESYGYPGPYHGDFSDAQVAWLEKDLSLVPDEKLVILCVHIPFEGLWKKYDNFRKVYDMLGARSHAVVVSGHTHTIKHLTYPNGLKEYVAGAMSGCWWWSKNCADGAPNGYSVWKISGNRVIDELYKGQNFKESYQMRMYRGDAVFGGEFEKFQLAHGSGTVLVNVWNWTDGWKSEVYENGKLCGELELMPTTTEMEAPFNGGKDWWAIGFNVGVVGRGHSKGSNRSSYCSKNYHMLKYTLKDPAAKVKVVVFDPYGRKFSCDKFYSVDDYSSLAVRPEYPADPAWN